MYVFNMPFLLPIANDVSKWQCSQCLYVSNTNEAQNLGCLVHDADVCFECFNDGLCGGKLQVGCQLVKACDLKKIIKVNFKKYDP